jgi:hypothetical protein
MISQIEDFMKSNIRKGRHGAKEDASLPGTEEKTRTFEATQKYKSRSV